MSTPELAADTDVPLDLRLSEAELVDVRETATSFVERVVDDAGADGAVIGLSGGVDSSTVASLAADALGPERVYGLVMPSDVTSAESTSDGERVATELGIDYDVVDVSGVVDAVLDAVPDDSLRDEAAADAEPARTAVGNVRVRARAVTNYVVANAENRVVLGTGNRSEAMTGYYTKYGDQAVDCNPIGPLYKQQVRQLATALDVPDRIVEKPPSAEMWLDQTDEGELGLDYDTLDAVLALHVDGPLSAAATVRTLDDVTAAQVDRVDDLVARSEHKRQMPPAPALEL
ncbi:MAG: NH(3)-dependent NAD(+) synthetase [uncultured archaeon A07HB70]|nr:MAG: NH(3)-dependent NAD(+) synthetase [uncultured archaeon A07HB70]